MKNVVLPVSADVIARVRRLRKDRKIAAHKLAELMTQAGYPTSRTAIAQAELGYIKQVSVDWVVAAAKALNVPAEVIFRGPECEACIDSPPEGFTCNSCEKASH